MMELTIVAIAITMKRMRLKRENFVLLVIINHMVVDVNNEIINLFLNKTKKSIQVLLENDKQLCALVSVCFCGLWFVCYFLWHKD